MLELWSTEYQKESIQFQLSSLNRHPGIICSSQFCTTIPGFSGSLETESGHEMYSSIQDCVLGKRRYLNTLRNSYKVLDFLRNQLLALQVACSFLCHMTSFGSAKQRKCNQCGWRISAVHIRNKVILGFLPKSCSDTDPKLFSHLFNQCVHKCL